MDLKSILDAAPIDKSLKADAWDNFQSATADDFQSRFDKLALPKELKANLWDAKFGTSEVSAVTATPTTPAASAPVAFPAPAAPATGDSFLESLNGWVQNNIFGKPPAVARPPQDLWKPVPVAPPGRGADADSIPILREFAQPFGTAAKSLVRGGSEGTVGMAGGLTQLAGNVTGADAVAKLGRQISDINHTVQQVFEKPPEIRGSVADDPKLLANPEWWLDLLGNGLGSMAPMLATGGLAAGGIHSLVKAGHLTSKLGQQVAKWTPATVAGITEGAQAGASAYDEAIREGKSPQEALRRFTIIAAGTAATSAVANKIGVFSDKIGRPAVRGAVSAGSEGLQEEAQGEIENYATGKPLGTHAIENTLGGVLTGGAVGAAHTYAGRQKVEQPPPAAAAPVVEAPPVEAATPPPVKRKVEIRKKAKPAVELDPAEVTPAPAGEVIGAESSGFTADETPTPVVKSVAPSSMTDTQLTGAYDALYEQHASEIESVAEADQETVADRQQTELAPLHEEMTRRGLLEAPIEEKGVANDNETELPDADEAIAEAAPVEEKQVSAPLPAAEEVVSQHAESVSGAEEKGEIQASDDTAPGTVAEVPIGDLSIDAPRFQFKANVGQGGAGDTFRDVKKFDPEKSGILSVWRDPADGKAYVVNGHHRYEMADRLGAKTLTVRYLKAKTATEARTKGALINIGEGTGESTDAAKVFRDSGMTEVELEKEGIQLKSGKAREGMALANLAGSLFDKVIAGDIPPARGAVIGEGLKSHADQVALYDQVAKRERGGKRATNDQIGEMIRLVNDGPKKTESTDAAQGGLFGAETVTRGLIFEKAEVSDYIRKQLTGEKRLFATVGTEAVAKTLGQSGNVILAGENSEVAKNAAVSIALYEKLSTHAGPVAAALDEAATQLANGDTSDAVKQRAYSRIRGALLIEGGRLSRGKGADPQGSGGRAEGLGSQGPRQASARKPDSPQKVEPVRIRYKPGRKGQPGTLFGNYAASRLLGHLVGWGEDGPFVGLNITRSRAENLIRLAQWEIHNKAQSSAGKSDLRQMVVALRATLNSRGSVVFVEGGRNLGDIRSTLTHERFHNEQRERADFGKRDEHVDVEWFFFEDNAELTRRVADVLIDDLGYGELDLDVLAAEVGAHVAAGPANWARLGITKEEAREVLYRYALALIRRHGSKIVFKFRSISPILREDFYDAGKNADGEERSEDDGDESAGEPAQEVGGQAGRLESSSQERRQKPEERPGSHVNPDASQQAPDSGGTQRIDRAYRALAERRVQGPEGIRRGFRQDVPGDAERQDDLFGSGDSNAAAESAGKEKLNADRLTAEFNSPLNRNNLRTKLKPGQQPAQSSMFEEDAPPPAQRGFFDDESGTHTPGALVDAAKAAAKSDVVKGGVDFFRPLGSRIRSEGPAATRLMDTVTRARDLGEVRAGPKVVKLMDAKLQDLSRDEAFTLVDVLEGRLPATNPKVATAATAARALLDEQAQEAIALGVEVTVKKFLYPGEAIPAGLTLNPLQQAAWDNGKRIRVTYKRPFEEKKNYYPHSIPGHDRLKHGYVRDSQIRNDVIENLVRLHVKPTKAGATAFLDSYITFMESGQREQSLIDYMTATGQARTEADAFELLKNMREASTAKKQGSLEHSRQANLPFWDPDPRRVLPSLIASTQIRLSEIEHLGGQKNAKVKAMVNAVRKAGGKADFVDAKIKEILGLIDEPDTNLEKVSGFLRMLQGFQLGMASIPNVTQGVLNSWFYGDLRAALSGVKGVATKKGRRFGIESGAALEATLLESMRHAGASNEALSAFLRATGMSVTERMNRILAANAGAAYTKRMAARARLGDERAKRKLKEFGLDPAGVVANGLTPGDLLMAAKKFSDITQFRSRPEDLPDFTSSPVGKVAFQFKNYIYGQTRLLDKEIRQELFVHRSPGRAARSLLVLAIAFPLTGALVNFIRDGLKGKDDEDDPLERYLHGIAATGALGAFLDMFEASEHRQVAGYIGGPTVGAVSEAAQLRSMEALKKAAFRRIPLFGPLLVNRVFPKPDTSGDRELRRLLGNAP